MVKKSISSKLRANVGRTSKLGSSEGDGSEPASPSDPSITFEGSDADSALERVNAALKAFPELDETEAEQPKPETLDVQSDAPEPSSDEDTASAAVDQITESDGSDTSTDRELSEADDHAPLASDDADEVTLLKRLRARRRKRLAEDGIDINEDLDDDAFLDADQTPEEVAADEAEIAAETQAATAMEPVLESEDQATRDAAPEHMTPTQDVDQVQTGATAASDQESTAADAIQVSNDQQKIIDTSPDESAGPEDTPHDAIEADRVETAEPDASGQAVQMLEGMDPQDDETEYGAEDVEEQTTPEEHGSEGVEAAKPDIDAAETSLTEAPDEPSDKISHEALSVDPSSGEGTPSEPDELTSSTADHVSAVEAERQTQEPPQGTGTATAATAALPVAVAAVEENPKTLDAPTSDPASSTTAAPAEPPTGSEAPTPVPTPKAKMQKRVAAVLETPADTTPASSVLVNGGAGWAFALALSGAIPFVVGAVAQWWPILLGNYAYLALPALLWYGAVILSFLGGIRWGLALRVLQPKRRIRLMILSVVPSLLGWFALFLPSQFALVALMIGFAGQGAWDTWTAEHSGAPPWFITLRVILSIIVVTALLVALIGYSEVTPESLGFV